MKKTKPAHKIVLMLNAYEAANARNAEQRRADMLEKVAECAGTGKRSVRETVYDN